VIIRAIKGPLAAPVSKRSILFDASTSDHCVITDAAQTGLDLGSDFTIMGWAYFNTLPAEGDQEEMTSKWLNPGNDRNWLLPNFRRLSGTQVVEAVVQTASNNIRIERVTWTLSTGVWRHVAVCNDASQSGSADQRFRFVLDGVDQGVSTIAANGTGVNQRTGAADVHINSFTALSALSFVDGFFDEVAFFDAALSEATINSLKDAVIPDATSNFLCAWSWDGDSLTSHGPHTNLLTNNGGAFDANVPI